MQKKILIRADASNKIGMGHLMRCLALAEAFNRHRIKSIFVMKRLLGDPTGRIITRRGFNAEIMPLGTTKEEDLLFLSGAIKRHKPLSVIVDSYFTDISYKKKIKKTGCVMASISRSLKSDFYSDVIINQSIAADEKDYAGRTREDTVLLLGAKYFLLRDEFKLLRKKRRPSLGRKKITSVLVTMGGADPNGDVLKVLKALRQMNEDIFLKIILGPAHRKARLTGNFVRQNFPRSKIYRSPRDVGSIMSSSDIAISSGGVTALELAYLGIPAIIMAIAENQIENARALGEKGAALFLGESKNLRGAVIRTALKELMRDRKRQITMSSNGQSLVDGLGPGRVAKCLRDICC